MQENNEKRCPSSGSRTHFVCSTFSLLKIQLFSDKQIVVEKYPTFNIKISRLLKICLAGLHFMALPINKKWVTVKDQE